MGERELERGGSLRHRIGPGIVARRPVMALREAYRRTDIIALDLDECIFPGFSQAALGARVAGRILRRPQQWADRRFLPRMALGGCFLALKEGKRALGVETPFRILARRYERVMRGIPEGYIAEAAAALPARSYPCAAETVALLAEQAPTGIISLGLDVVIEAYRERWVRDDAPLLSFAVANAVRFRPTEEGRVFDGYDWSSLLENGEGKRGVLEGQMRQRDARVPTMVGHDPEDVPLARLCRERGGLAVGFNPAAGVADAFDVVVRGCDWERMFALTTILSDSERRI